MKQNDVLKPLSSLDDLGTDNPDVKYLIKETKKYKNIKNIGVIGPYGSGKSSVTRSFVKSRDKKFKKSLFFSQETISEHLEEKETKQEFSTVIKGAIYKELLKYDTKSLSYLKYLDYLVIPFSKRFLLHLILLLFLFGVSYLLTHCCIFVLSFNIFPSILVGVVFFLLLLILYLSFYVSQIGVTFRAFSANVELTFDEKKQGIYEQIKNHPTALDNLIVYLIKTSKIKHIVIEDMERLKEKEEYSFYKFENHNEDVALAVIKQFKILSDLLNRSKLIRKRVIFIYEINDQCFNEPSARTKFFDLIVPIVPISTYASAAHVILNTPYIKELDDGKLDKTMVDNLSLYFLNQRQINAFLSQFYLSIQKIKSNDYNELFALTALAILFPKQYHDINSRDNDLDKMLKDFSDGKDIFAQAGSFKSFVEDNPKNFIKTCIIHKYISKNYYLYLTITEITFDKVVGPEDLEIIKKFNAGGDIFDEQFNNPLAILQRFSNVGFLTSVEKINPQLLECAIENRITDYLTKFVSTINLLNEKKTLFAKLLSFGEKTVICDYLYKNFKSENDLYNSIELVKDEKKGGTTLALLQNIEPKFLLNHKSELLNFNEYIIGPDFTKNYLEKMNKSRLQDVLELRIYKFEDVSVVKDEKTIKLIQNNCSYSLSYKNLTFIHKEFKTKPFNVLLNDVQLSKEFRLLPHPQIILDECENKDEPIDVLKFMLNCETTKVENLLSSKYFDDGWKYKIVVPNHESINKPNSEAIMTILLKNGVLDLNSAFEYCFATNTSILIKYISDNTGIIIKNKYAFNEKLSKALVKNLDCEKLELLINQLDVSSNDLATNATPFEKCKLLLTKLDDESQIKYLKELLKTDNKSFNSLLSDKLVKQEVISKVPLTLASVESIFDKDLRDYFPTMLLTINKSNFETFIKNPNGRTDFAKLIFDEYGELFKDIDSDSLALVCSNETTNLGALDKVFSEIDASEIKSEAWINLLKQIINEYKVKESGAKVYLKENDTIRKIMKKYETAGKCLMFSNTMNVVIKLV